MSDFTSVLRKGKLGWAFMLFLLIFNVGLSFSQNDLQLTLIEKSDKPKTEPEHVYTFEVKNTSRTETQVAVKVANTNCGNAKKSQSNLQVTVLNQVQKSFEPVSLKPGQTMIFYVKTSRDARTKLGSWSCIEVTAASTSGNTIKSGSVTIEQLIPDPNSFE